MKVLVASARESIFLGELINEPYSSVNRSMSRRSLPKAQRDALWEHLHRGAIKTTIARLVRAHADAGAAARPLDVTATVLGGLARLDASDITVAVVDVPGRAVVVTRACYEELQEQHAR